MTKITMQDIMRKAWKFAKREANKLRAHLSYKLALTVKPSQYISWALTKAWALAKGEQHA